MKKIYRSGWTWLAWFGLILCFGSLGGWSTLDKALLGLVLAAGVLRLVAFLHVRKLRQLQAMSPEEREQDLATLDQKTQELFRQQLEEFNEKDGT